ncbi:MAG: tetratricopeptide repeat protein [Bacteroidia bacterium]
MWQKFIQSNLAIFAVLLAVAFASYSPVLNGPFLFDDEFFIEKNESVKEFKVKEIYTTGVTQGASVNGNFYRPNQQFAFAVITKLFGQKPVVFHAFSILCHTLAAFLLFLFFAELGFSRNGSFIGSFIFLLHPAQTEAVSYISGLADPLSAIFLLSGLLFLSKGLKEKLSIKFMLPAFIFFVLALFTKENMVVFLPLAIAVAVYFFFSGKTKPGTKLWVWLLVFVALDLTYFTLKFTVFKFGDEAGLTAEKNLYTENLHIRIITFFNILPEYFKLFLFPKHLNYEKPYTAYTELMNARVFISFIALSVFGLSVYFIKKKPALFLGAAYFFAALAPFTGIIPLNSMYLEHWIYIPMIGLIILLVVLFELLEKKKLHWAIAVVIIPVLMFFSVRTFSRNKEWASIEKFYLNELNYSQDAIRIYNNLGMFYAGKKQYSKAISYYQKAIKKWDNFPQPHHNIANIYLDTNRPEDALNELYNALRIDPNFLYSLDKLQLVYATYGREDKAQVIRSWIGQIQQGGKIEFAQIDALMRAQ